MSKPLRIVGFIGPKGSGKSSFVGHFMYNLGCLTERGLQKLKVHAQEIGEDESRAFCYITDITQLERKAGYSCQPVPPQIVHTPNSLCGVLPIPGSLRYIKTIALLVSITDLLVLVVGADQFESTLFETEQHLKIASAISLASQILVVITKADSLSVNIRLQRLKDIEQALTAMASKYFTVSGVLYCDNTFSTIIHHTDVLQRSFFDMLHDIPFTYKYQQQLEEEQRLCVPITFSYRIGGIGTVVTGRVLSGYHKLKPGVFPQFSHLLDFPIFKEPRTVKVFSLERFYESIVDVCSLDYVGINLKGIHKSHINHGMVMGDFHIAKWIQLKIETLEKCKLARDTQLRLFTNSGTATARILRVLGKTTDNKGFVEKGVFIHVCCKVLSPLVLTTMSDYPLFSRVFVFEQGKVMGFGEVVRVIGGPQFQDLAQSWPLFHDVLDVGCSDAIETFICCLKDNNNNNNTGLNTRILPFELVKKVVCDIILKWMTDENIKKN